MIGKGQCGVWVLDLEQESVLGMVVAHCPELHEAYLVPLHQIIDDIKRKGYGKNVDLLSKDLSRPLSESHVFYSSIPYYQTTTPSRARFYGRPVPSSAYPTSSSGPSSIFTNKKPARITYGSPSARTGPSTSSVNHGYWR